MTTKDALLAWNAAVKLAEAKKYLEALHKFSEIKDNVHALPSRMHFNVGSIQFILCDYDAALESLNESIRRDSLSAASYFRRGTILYAQESYLDAHKEFVVCAEYLRNGLVDYTQLGLKCKLFKCEALYNAGISMLKAKSQDQAVEAFALAQSAQQETPEIKNLTKKLDIEGTLVKAKTGASTEELTLVDPMKERLFTPPLAKVKNLATKDYLGKATVVSSVTDKDTFSGFDGPRKLESSAAESAGSAAKQAAPSAEPKPATAESRPPPPQLPPGRLPKAEPASQAPSGKPSQPPAAPAGDGAAAARLLADARANAAADAVTAVTFRRTAPDKAPPPRPAPALQQSAAASAATAVSATSMPIATRAVPPPPTTAATNEEVPGYEAPAPLTPSRAAAAVQAGSPASSPPPLRPAVAVRPSPSSPEPIPRQLLPRKPPPIAAAATAPSMETKSDKPRERPVLPPLTSARAAETPAEGSDKPAHPSTAAAAAAEAPAVAAAQQPADRSRAAGGGSAKLADRLKLFEPRAQGGSAGPGKPDAPLGTSGSTAAANGSAENAAAAAAHGGTAGVSPAGDGRPANSMARAMPDQTEAVVGAGTSSAVLRTRKPPAAASGRDSAEGKLTSSAKNRFINLELVIGEETEALCVKMETLDVLHSRIGEKLSCPAESFSLWYEDQFCSKVKIESDDMLQQLWALRAPTGNAQLWCYARW